MCGDRHLRGAARGCPGILDPDTLLSTCRSLAWSSPPSRPARPGSPVYRLGNRGSSGAHVLPIRWHTEETVRARLEGQLSLERWKRGDLASGSQFSFSEAVCSQGAAPLPFPTTCQTCPVPGSPSPLPPLGTCQVSFEYQGLTVRNEELLQAKSDPPGKSFDQTLREQCTNGPESQQEGAQHLDLISHQREMQINPQGDTHCLTLPGSAEAKANGIKPGCGMASAALGAEWHQAWVPHGIRPGCGRGAAAHTLLLGAREHVITWKTVWQRLKVKCAPSSTSASRCLPKSSEDVGPHADGTEVFVAALCTRRRDGSIQTSPRVTRRANFFGRCGVSVQLNMTQK